MEILLDAQSEEAGGPEGERQAWIELTCLDADNFRYRRIQFLNLFRPDVDGKCSSPASADAE
jgi:hypothetical protein